MAIIAVSIATLLKPKTESPSSTPRDYAEIAQSGVLRATTEYNTLSLYVDKDTLSGFYYEILKAFAKEHDLKLEINPEMSFKKRMEGLANGDYDLIAYGLQATSLLKDSLLLTTPITLSKHVLVQREPTSIDDSTYIKSQLELAGKTVHVVKGSPAILRIHNLSNEIGDTIYIKEIEKYGSEQLMEMVAHGDIDYAICEENIARILCDSLPQIDIHTAISFTQSYSWGVSKQSPHLLDTLNNWLETFKKKDAYKALVKKYY